MWAPEGGCRVADQASLAHVGRVSEPAASEKQWPTLRKQLRIIVSFRVIVIIAEVGAELLQPASVTTFVELRSP